jgi:glycosyltransferase involved in cell wall biosynthesis
LRVLLVATQIQLPGTHGGSTHVGELVRFLGKRGPVLTLARRGSTAPGTLGVSFHTGYPALVRHLLPAVYFPKALSAAREFRPDVIYERASSYGLGAMLSAALGVPLLAMVLDEHYSWLTLKRAARIVATTAEVVPRSVQHKLVKVGWGANTELFHPLVTPVSSDRLPKVNVPTLCYVGSFKRWHGLSTLVEAAALAGPNPHRTLLVGDGPLRAELEAEVARRGLSSAFVFAGAIDYEEVPHWIAASDICVAPFQPDLHPRSRQGFVLDPLKVFEYLAMQKPTLTADTENLRALFRDREHLRLLPSGDAEALCAAIRELSEHPSEANAMAARGKERVFERHTWAAHVDHLYRLFHEIRA